jgi:uncharacterized protein (TIGR03437 family)
MRSFLALTLGVLAGLGAAAQTAPALAIDAKAGVHPISAYVYGINEWGDNGLMELMRIPLVRWGGDDATAYNWQTNVKNNTGDNPWCFENYSVSPGFDQIHNANLAAGTVTLGTISLMDWTAGAAGACSFSVKKYGTQKAVNPGDADCGNGVLLSGAAVNNDPTDAYTAVTTGFSQQWVQHLMTSFGPANAGGVRLFDMDNEPEYWVGTHADIYKNNATYADMLSRNLKWAQAVKAVDPTALVVGPVPGGWIGMLFSWADANSGWSTYPYQYWDNPVEYNEHGQTYWIPYYLQQMQQFEQQNGYRLLDVLDVHAYITPSGLSGSVGDAAMETLRMTSTREFWDPNYYPPGGGYEDATGAEQAPQMVPRLRQWVADNYPGTKTAITEYSWGAMNSITGAIAQADIFGIFGRESLDYGTMWGTPNPTDPGAFAMKIFLNYDGNGSQFGGTSVSATSDNSDVLSIFAAQRNDSALTVLVLNKTAGDLADTISLANFTPAGTAQVWQYSAANLGAIVRQSPDLSVSSGGVSTTFPAQSMTLLVIPQAQSAMSVPQPVVTAVTSAASYDASGVSPGEIVAIWGQGLGPAAGANLELDSSGLLTTSLGGTQVFINGNPAPLTYAGSKQVNAIVPYQVATATTANVVVVYQGNASAPLPVLIAAVKPGIFTNGHGQGAVLNFDYSVNSPANPATRGQYVFIYATGEGVTIPPGVDGRVTGTPLPTAAAANCAATMGGQPAPTNFCGEAPGFTAGVMQVNALVPESVAPGNAVPVTITIGGVTSQAGVTLAVK